MPLNTQSIGLCEGKGKGCIPKHCRAAGQDVGIHQTEAKSDKWKTHPEKAALLSVGALRCSIHPKFEFIYLFAYIH